MTTAVVSVPAAVSLHEAAGRMLDAGVGSVVVTTDGDPAGILTEYDFVDAGHEHDDRSFTEIPVYAAASRPLETVEPTATVDRAAHQMHETGVSHLPVADGLDLVGIVTTTDLVGVRDELDDDAERALRERADWTASGSPGGTD
nr:CBS domain-containing protein [Halobacterium sp. TGN-42-S1]